jgi:diguanylate cyclase (GGDEF)-like protein
MISFLAVIDRAGKIHEVIWSDPAYIVSMHHPSFFQLFPDSEMEALLAAIGKCASGGHAARARVVIGTSGREAGIDLYMLPMDMRLLVLAVEAEELPGNGGKAREAIIHKFMETIKGYSLNSAFHNNKSTNLQFEGIQTLNNELTNTRRLLEKANAQLILFNNDLNNRLVRDALTGLVSRYQYRAEIEFFIAENPGKLGIFTFIDIDDFKQVNDRYGHAAGDAYLVEFARRLKNLPIEKSVKMRISGDEFGLFSYGLDQAGIAETAGQWQKIKEHVLSRPIDIDGQNLPITISAGMAVYGVDTAEIYELIEYADAAMYVAKKGGKNGYRVFSKEACRQEDK